MRSTERPRFQDIHLPVAEALATELCRRIPEFASYRERYGHEALASQVFDSITKDDRGSSVFAGHWICEPRVRWYQRKYWPSHMGERLERLTDVAASKRAAAVFNDVERLVW